MVVVGGEYVENIVYPNGFICTQFLVQGKRS